MSLKSNLVLIKNILKEISFKFKTIKSLSKLQTKFPNSKIYKDSILDNINLGNYSIVFNNVTMHNSDLGSHSYIQKNSTIINAEIGSFCSIAANVSIGPGIHFIEGVSTHPIFYLKNTPLVKKYCTKDLFDSTKRTIIGNDVWIGEKVIILDGINIGDGAIIAAGAVVVKDVAPYSIVGGIPAKLIKYRFDEITISKLMKTKWWEKPEEWIEKNHNSFQDVNHLLEIIEK